MTRFEQVMMRREQIRSVAAKHGAKRLMLFGSVVRHEDGQDSDVDVLVSMSSGRDLLDFMALKRELDTILPKPADLVTDDELSPYLRERIMEEAVPI